jgi:hypothetical protein
MTQLNVLEAARNEGAVYKVDVSRGQRIGRVSSEWFSRPADERYLSLSLSLNCSRGTRTRRAKPDPYGREPKNQGGSQPHRRGTPGAAVAG